VIIIKSHRIKYILVLSIVSIIIFLITACSSSEAIAATTATTAATFEMSTLAETSTAAITTTTFYTTQPETTPPQTTTVSDTAPPVIYNDDEQTLKNLITEKTDKELLFWEYGDLDNNGTFEAFAFTGKFSEADGGSLCIVNSNGLVPIGNITCDEIRSFSCDGNQFIYTYYNGAINRQEIWGVDGENFYKAPISDIGINLTSDENEDITLMAVAADNITFDEDNINGANTWKPYYFYYDNGFHEYGGSEISLEEFLTYEDADTFVDEIKNLNGEITNILKRGNGIINVNYTVFDPEKNLKWNYYYTLKTDDGKVMHINVSTNDEGVYLPALLSEIATYSCILYPVYQDGSYDYIDKTGKVVIDGNFETASLFSEGYGVVSKNGKYGFIDTAGNYILKPTYDEIGDFHCGRAYVVVGEHLGYVDTHGEIVVEIKYDSDRKEDIINNGIPNRDYSENDVIVESDFRKLVLDINGNVTCKDLDYYGTASYVSDLHDGLINIYGNYYDKNGYLVIPDKWHGDYVRINHYPWAFSEGLAKYPTCVDPESGILWPTERLGANLYGDYRNWKTMYIDKSGNYAFDNQFDLGGSFSGGLCVVQSDGKYGVINTDGEFVFQTERILGDGYKGGLVSFQDEEEGKYGFLNTKGNVIVKPLFDSVYQGFQHDLALVKIENDLAYIDFEGNIVYRFDYSEDLLYWVIS
jgi:hypothetical protein